MNVLSQALLMSESGTTPAPPAQSSLVATYDTSLIINNEPVYIHIGDYAGGPVSVSVDWGDGTVTPVSVNGEISHQYAVAGVHVVTITGTMTGVDLASSTNIHPTGLVSVDSWDDAIGLTQIYLRSPKLVSVPATLLTTITSTEEMFAGASIFNQNINSWDVSRVINMNAMFYLCSSYNQPMDLWDVSHVTTMTAMFRGASVFNSNVSTWDTSSVTNMSLMFASNGNFNQNIGSWNVSLVTNMSYMFLSNSRFNQYIGSWNTGSVTDMRYMFSSASRFNQNIGSWNVSRVTNMIYMFYQATAFNQVLTRWCVTLIPSRPSNFSTSSGLPLAKNPVWGTCPP